jgi:hypothetical protein
MAERVRYIVQAYRNNVWVTIRNCTSYKKAVAVAKKSENRRLMVQTLMSDLDCWREHGSWLGWEEWQMQSDVERDAVEMARRQL